MFAAMFKGLAKLAFLAATMAFLSAVSLMLLGAFLTTWPIMRKSPRERKLQATMNLAAAGMQMLGAFQSDTPTDTVVPVKRDA